MKGALRDWTGEALDQFADWNNRSFLLRKAGKLEAADLATATAYLLRKTAEVLARDE